MEGLTEKFLKSRGHKYLRKIPDGRGGWRYIYEEPGLKTDSVETREQKYKRNGLDYNTSSKEEYKGDPARKRLHRETVKEYVKRSSRLGSTPVAVFTLGGSGAGKGTVLKMLKMQKPLFSNIVTVDSDDFKMKTFKEDFEVYNKQLPGSAARRLHDESSDLAEEVVDGIIEANNDYLKDGTFKSYDKAMKEIMKAKKRGYEVHIVGVTIPVEEALKRAKARAERTGREIKPDVIIAAHKGSTETFLKLLGTRIVNSMKLYDNTTVPPTLIYDNSTGGFPVKDKVKFEQFKSKKDFVMSKEEKDKIEKSAELVIYESDKEFKRRFQASSKEEQEQMWFDLPQDADEWDMEITRKANEWLRDGQPVD